jgi:hypothetical protein
MSLLVKTEAALRNLAANNHLVAGSHRGRELEVADYGIPVGSVDYDEFGHLPIDIDPFDFVGEMITGKKQVAEVKPFKPIDINVVVHHDAALLHTDPNREGRSALTDLAAGRLALARNLQQAIKGARPGMYDRVHTYLVGDTLPKVLPQGMIVKPNTEEPLAAATAAAELGRKRLTYVIGGFRRFPLEQVENADYSKMIAIIADHQSDRALQPGSGTWLTGHPQMPDVNTGDPIQLNRWNTHLQALHDRRVNRLGGLGLTVVEAVFKPDLPPMYMDTAQIDLSLAAATASVGKKL